SDDHDVQCAPACPRRFSNATATTERYTLSLHDALPISTWAGSSTCASARTTRSAAGASAPTPRRRPPSSPPRRRRCGRRPPRPRSEEHTSELQSRENLVCRLLLEKKKINRSK